MTATRRLVEALVLAATLCVGGCTSHGKAGPTPTSSSTPTRSEAEACDLDLKTLQTAEEAYYALNNTYGTYAQLVSAQFLTGPETDSLHTIALSSDNTSYTITGTGKNNCTMNYP